MQTTFETFGNKQNTKRSGKSKSRLESGARIERLARVAFKAKKAAQRFEG